MTDRPDPTHGHSPGLSRGPGDRHDDGHGHGGHDHGRRAALAGQRHRGRLWGAFAVTAAIMLVELVTALATGSLALLSDAGHMFTDVIGLGMALAAAYAVTRAVAHPQRTYGLYRLEVLAALGNAVLLGAVAIYVLVEAVRRIVEPHPVPAGPMMIVATVGLLGNLVAFALLRSAAGENINLRAAYLEVVGDLAGSVGVLLAGLVILLTGWLYADPIVAILVGLFILPRTWRLARAAVRILVQAAPEHVDVAEVARTLNAVPGVCDVHDLHVWTLTSGMDVASAHLTLDGDADLGRVLTAARTALHDGYSIDHATLQVEPRGCADTTW